jgi:hypothetical protein
MAPLAIIISKAAGRIFGHSKGHSGRTRVSKSQMIYENTDRVRSDFGLVPGL